MKTETIKTFTTPSAESEPLEWLKNNYTFHKISELARRVGKSISETCGALQIIGANLELTKAQEGFIREYYCEYTVKELTFELADGNGFNQLLENKIVYFIQMNGIKKNSDQPVDVAPKKKFRRVHEAPQNRSQADRVSFWLSMSDSYIKNHKGRIKY